MRKPLVRANPEEDSTLTPVGCISRPAVSEEPAAHAALFASTFRHLWPHSSDRGTKAPNARRLVTAPRTPHCYTARAEDVELRPSSPDAGAAQRVDRIHMGVARARPLVTTTVFAHSRCRPHAGIAGGCRGDVRRLLPSLLFRPSARSTPAGENEQHMHCSAASRSQRGIILPFVPCLPTTRSVAGPLLRLLHRSFLSSPTAAPDRQLTRPAAHVWSIAVI
jgi:hypothetical protein